jgi:hypothetical protein
MVLSDGNILIVEISVWFQLGVRKRLTKEAVGYRLNITLVRHMRGMWLFVINYIIIFNA